MDMKSMEQMKHSSILNGDESLQQSKQCSFPARTDVLIVGSGPAALILATQLAQIQDIDYLIIERRPTKLRRGHADGLQVRSLEMFQALGFADPVIKEAYHVNEMTFWEPDGKGGISRSGRSKDTIKGTSEMPHVILTQARLHEHMLKRLSESHNPAAPFYGCRFIGLQKISCSPEGYNEVLVEHTNCAGGIGRHSIRARFVVGCDGAHSMVRQALGLSMHGDPINSIWGVMDALTDTDFPDIRMKVCIRSAMEGAILIIPKSERQHMVSRVYVELDRIGSCQSESSTISQDTIISKAKMIFRPYQFHVKEVLWWSRYDIGQRLCKTFDNSSQAQSWPSVFIAGDACHTHSPKAGQGMNVSMADAFNLGWKLAAVIRGQVKPEILQTYSTERQPVAEELINFDQSLTRIFSSYSDLTNGDELQNAHKDKAAFLAGIGIRYSASLIQTGQSQATQILATGFPIGQRFHSTQVLRCADASPIHLGHSIVADGRWRIVIFAGRESPADRLSRTWKLCEWLETDSDSPVVRYTPPGEDVDSIIEVFSVYRHSHASFNLNEVPSLIRPRHRRHYNVRAHDKILTNWWDGGDMIDDAYELRCIDKDRGAMVLVRPDQFVANVLDLEDLERLAEFFNGFMIATEALTFIDGTAGRNGAKQD